MSISIYTIREHYGQQSFIFRRRSFQQRYQELMSVKLMKNRPDDKESARACSWCNKVYQCRDLRRLHTVLMVSKDDINDILRLMGTKGNEDVTYMIKNHPYHRKGCSFVSHVLRDKIKDLNPGLEAYAYKRGLYSIPDILRIVKGWIHEGTNEETCLDIIRNNFYVKPSFMIKTFDMVDRFYRYYLELRRLMV